MRKAFTLIELLVVIAIITLIVGILLPAINAAREAGRKAQCITRQKNIAIGLLNYESAIGYLPGWRDFITVTPPVVVDALAAPVGFGTQPGDEIMAHASWVFSILPHIEQTDLFERLKAGQVEVATPSPIPHIAILHCPSLPDAPQGRGTNYVVNGGATDDFSSRDPGVTTDGSVANGPFLDRASIVAYDATNLRYTSAYGFDPTHRHAVARLESISKMDGTAYTLLTSENCQRGFWISEEIVHFYHRPNYGGNRVSIVSADWVEYPPTSRRWAVSLEGLNMAAAVTAETYGSIEGSVAFCWPRNYFGSAIPSPPTTTPTVCYPTGTPGNPKVGFAGDVTTANKIDGDFASVVTIDELKVPCFLNMFKRKNFPASWYHSARPSSFHPGSVVASFCDGNVRSINENISEIAFVQQMVAGAAKSDAGKPIPETGAPPNFLEGRLFDGRSL